MSTGGAIWIVTGLLISGTAGALMMALMQLGRRQYPPEG